MGGSLRVAGHAQHPGSTAGRARCPRSRMRLHLWRSVRWSGGIQACLNRCDELRFDPDWED